VDKILIFAALKQRLLQRRELKPIIDFFLNLKVATAAVAIF